MTWKSIVKRDTLSEKQKKVIDDFVSSKDKVTVREVAQNIMIKLGFQGQAGRAGIESYLKENHAEKLE
jgi:hypothetical protein